MYSIIDRRDQTETQPRHLKISTFSQRSKYKVDWYVALIISLSVQSSFLRKKNNKPKMEHSNKNINKSQANTCLWIM